MITAVVYDLRRMLRWRLSWLILAAPVFVLVCSRAGVWLGRPVNSALAFGMLLASAAILFVQFMLSDRGGNFKWALVTSPARRWMPPVRLVLLCAGPFLLQLGIYHFGLRLLR